MKVVIPGATTNPSRYAYLATNMLLEYGHDVALLGIKRGAVSGIPILNIRDKPDLGEIDTMSMYLGPVNQSEWLDYFISLKPKRIIFNPGTENDDFYEMAEGNGIEIVEGCTLVMLRSGTF